MSSQPYVFVTAAATDLITTGSVLAVQADGYTPAQLDTLFQNANMGEAPDAATQLLLNAYAFDIANGSLTNSQALLDALHIPPPAGGAVGSNTPENTTDVALAVYQFFAGVAPTLGGLAYLVNGGGNLNDLDSAYYAGFNQANRYYNFAINLITGNAAAEASFQSTYGSLTFNQTISTAYELIIGAPNVSSSAATAAISAIEAQLPYFEAVAAHIAPTVNPDLAAKAVAIAYILEEGVKADVGYYANAIDQFDIALANGAAIPGETSSGVDMLSNLGNVALHANLGDASATLQGAAGAGFTDIITGTDGNNNLSGTVNGGNTDIRLGDGLDFIYIYSGSANYVSLGNGVGDRVYDYSNGAEHISIGNGDFAGVQLSGDFTADVTIGNGAHDEVVAVNDSGDVTIRMGGGNDDFVELGAGHGVVTFGAGIGDNAAFEGSGISTVSFAGPQATVSFGDYSASFATPTTPSQAAILTANLNVVSGLAAGEILYIPALNDSIATAHNLAGVANAVVLATGTYSAAAETFTYGAAGHDALLTYDVGSSTFVSVVLVGLGGEVGHSTILGEAVTL
jgi:S-layer protein